MPKNSIAVQTWASLAFFMGGVTTGILSVIVTNLVGDGPVLVPAWLLWGCYACYCFAVMACMFVQNAKMLGWAVFTYFIVLLAPELAFWLMGEDWLIRNRAQWLRELIPTATLVLVSMASLYITCFPPWLPDPPVNDISDSDINQTSLVKKD